MFDNPAFLAALLSGSSFSPLSLFSQGEQGVWYDPSDFSTMFQDAAGTTPVTAVEQPVGLVLDKSRGLVLGPELVTNGDFSSGSTGWVLGSGWSVSGGAASKATATSGVLSQTGLSFVAGTSYLVTFTSNVVGSDTFNVRIWDGGSNIADGPTFLGSGAKRFILTAPTSANRISIFPNNTSSNGSFDNFSVTQIAGNHLTQSTSINRPVMRQDGNGCYYLAFNGTNSFLASGTITPGVDKAQVFAGVRKASDALQGILLETSANIGTNTGALNVFAPDANAATTYQFSSKGTTRANTIVSGFAAPITNVVTGLGDISGASNIVRVNGTQVGSTLTSQGTGNYLAYPLYVGARAGASGFFNGNLYSLILRFSATNMDAATIASTETWVNSKTRAY